MATQIIQFSFDAGETLAVVTALVSAPETTFAANSVAEVDDGLYEATFVDQELPIGLHRFKATSSDEFLGNGLVDIAAAAGVFREVVEALATIDAAEVAGQINVEGVAIKEFKDAALEQLRQAEIETLQWDPQSDPLKIYRGMDHLQETSNAFHFNNVSGSWPDLSVGTIRLELRIGGVTVVAGLGTETNATGANQHFYIEVLRDAFDAATIKDGTGVFAVVRTDGAGKRFPLAHGVVTLFPNTAPAT